MHYKLYFLFTFLSQLAYSQTLTVSQNQLNFGNTYEDAPDSVQLNISNPQSSAVQINGIRFYSVYGSIPFSVRDSIFTLAPSASKTIWVKFKPVQNTAHNSELVILNNSHRGNISVDIIGQGKYRKSYYSTTENLSEQTLKDTLQAITGRGYTQLGYNGGRDKMFMTVDNKKVNGQGASVNTLECVYTGRNAVGYANRTACQNMPYDFNTEHTFPQGYFNSAEPMVSDLFHLYPTDNTANNIRSSFRFGMPLSTPTWSNGGSNFATPFFEPRDQHKGEVARAMFYFVIRYQNYQGFLTTQEATLRAWLHSFPSNAIEIKRNIDIHSFQHNWNPFIDYPQFVDRISSISATSIAPAISSIDRTDSLIDYGFITPLINTAYSYVVVNTGNTAVNFSNFSLSNTVILSFVSGSGINTTLQPGEALNVKINLNTTNTDSLFEYFNYSTDIPNSLPVHVPIFANFHQLPLSTQSPFIALPEMNLFPNPSSGELNLYYQLNAITKGEFNVFNAVGSLVYSQVLQPGTRAALINLSNLSNGIYSCQLHTENGTLFKKLVVVN